MSHDPLLTGTILGAIREAMGSTRIRFRQEPELVPSGHETAVYALELEDGPLGTEGPLILRLFADVHSRAASFEAAVHDGLLGQGFPVPEVIASSDEDPAFLLMRRIPGRAVGDGVEYDGSTRKRLAGVGRLAQISVRLPRWLAQTTSRLLTLDPGPVVTAAEARGVGADAFGFDRLLDALAARVDRLGLEGFREGLQWLLDARPPDPDDMCVCHGDLPPNLLTDDGEVTSVIDWSSEFATIGDPAYELANSRFLLQVPIPLPRFLRQGSEAYQGSLVRRFERSLVMSAPPTAERIAYYEAYRRLLSLVGGAEVWLACAAGADFPDRPDPWTMPRIAERVAAAFRASTGVALELPPPPPGR